MRFPCEWYQMEKVITMRLPNLRPAQQRGLLLWVYGTVRAQSGCQNKVLTALIPILGHEHALRERLQEYTRSGADRMVPCAVSLDPARYFAPVLRWVLAWWHGKRLALAIDVTYHHDRFMVIAISVLYRGTAIPVAWHMMRGHATGAWMPHIVRLLATLAPAIPADWEVLVMADAGLRSTTLWGAIHDHGWRPLLRLHLSDTFRPVGHSCRRVPVATLVWKAGTAWIGRGWAFSEERVAGTLVVIWQEGEPEPWAFLTAGAPQTVGVWWYSLRMWIELGFRALKGLGWHWEKTRRDDPERAARHWLVLAVATIWVLATGTRVEDALSCAMPPAYLHRPPPPRAPRCTRVFSVFALGVSALARQLDRGRLWRCLWFVPEPWPDPPPGLTITYHEDT